ncbi:MAG: hypothetical protein JWP44_4184 [Mucilaginibacter sp.]|nr:hypothetical protein [Mucilaginibacter sp.]
MRPSKFAGVRDGVIRAKARGLSDAQCAAEAGIDPTTLYRWLLRGENGEDPFASFWREFGVAEDAARRVRCAAHIEAIKAAA